MNNHVTHQFNLIPTMFWPTDKRLQVEVSIFFNNFFKIFLDFRKTSVHLQSQNQREAKLRYGVMVALQILALSVRVRVLLSQHSSKTLMAG